MNSLQETFPKEASIVLRTQVSLENGSMRLDKFLSSHFTTYSRSFFHESIKQQKVFVNGLLVSKPSFLVNSLDTVEVIISVPDKLTSEKQISNLDVALVHEDFHFLIINKPAGLIVHAPSTNSTEITLVDWLIQNWREIITVGDLARPGIVHRLDKNTSGIMIIPRTNYAHALIGDMFKNRTITKKYLAIVTGHPDRSGTIEKPIGRDPIHKIKMCAYSEYDMHRAKLNLDKTIRNATTSYTVLEYFKDCSLLEIHPTTGRTHQIRVHMASIGHALLGDEVYGQKSSLISRHALHAHQLAFSFEKHNYNFTATPPKDFSTLVESLAKKK